MEPEEKSEDEYYGVIIPFDTNEQAKFCKEEVKRVLGYGSWIHEGSFNKFED